MGGGEAGRRVQCMQRAGLREWNSEQLCEVGGEDPEVTRGDKAPANVQPSPEDPWQWRSTLRGIECSARFVDAENRITLGGCYRAEGDWLFFDGTPVPDDTEAATFGLVSKHRLTGRCVFDYFRGESSGRFFVIERNTQYGGRRLDRQAIEELSLVVKTLVNCLGEGHNGRR